MTSRANTLTLHLMGGLGNQLFQYAFGRRLALANHAELLLDISGYRAGNEIDASKWQRVCELTKFNIAARVIGSEQDARGLLRLVRIVRKAGYATVNLIDRLRPYYARRAIVEPASEHFRFDHRIYNRTFQGAIEARGFWQSEKYFHEIDSVLRREVTLRERLNRSNNDLARAITSSLSVAVHVRHGDNANSIAPELGVLPREYYLQALASLKAELNQPTFFAFSDDINWASGLLEGIASEATMVHNGSAGAAEDLWLMSRCKHHVLANSTFGWWGAWLGRKPDQIVYAPRRYYENVDRPNPDLYPPSWRLI